MGPAGEAEPEEGATSAAAASPSDATPAVEETRPEKGKEDTKEGEGSAGQQVSLILAPIVWMRD